MRRILIFFVGLVAVFSSYARTELCVSSYEKTANIYDSAVQNISKKQPEVWQRMLDSALVQVTSCYESSDFVIKSNGYLSASQASEQLGKFSDSKKYAEICLDVNMLNTLCYVQLASSNYVLKNFKEVQSAIAKGNQITKMASEKSEQALFDLTRKLQEENDYYKKQTTMLDIRMIRADLKNFEATRIQLEMWQSLLKSK